MDKLAFNRAIELNEWLLVQMHEAAEAGGYVFIEPEAVLVMMPFAGDWLCVWASGDMGRVCALVDSIPGCERVWWCREQREGKRRLRSWDRAQFTARARRLLHV